MTTKSQRRSTGPLPPPPANDKSNVHQLPLIDKKEAPQGPIMSVGVFNPNMLNYPSHEELMAVLLILGLQTRHIAGNDSRGNLVDLQGNVIVPVQLKRFFQLVSVGPLVTEAASKSV